MDVQGLTVVRGICTQLLGLCSTGLLLWLLMLSSLSEALAVLCQPRLGRGSVDAVLNE